MTPRGAVASGVERIGLAALKAPLHALFAIAALTAIALNGATKLQVQDAIDGLLRSDTAEYKTFERMRSLFPTSELNLLVVAQVPRPLDSATISKLRDVHLDLGLADDVVHVLSMFSVHRQDSSDGRVLPVIPDTLSNPPESGSLRELIESHPDIAGRFYEPVDDSQGLALFVAALDGQAEKDLGVTTMVDAIEQEVQAIESSTGLALSITGAPVMKADILEAGRRDALRLNVAGFTIGLLVCLLLFPSLRVVAIVILPTGLAVVFSLGLIGYLGIQLNALMNTIIPLVMVISLANGMHLSIAIMRAWSPQSALPAAIQRAMREVGPACVLSAATTALALASLALTDSHLISRFGLTAASAILISILVVLAVIPCLAHVLLRTQDPSARALAGFRFERELGSFLNNLSRRVVGGCCPVAVLGLMAIVASGSLYAQLSPSYRLTDVIPENQHADTAQLLDRHFSGINPVSVLVTAEKPITSESREVFAAVAEVHELLESHPQLASTHSLNDIVGGDAQTATGRLASLEALPETITARYISADGRSTVVSASAKDLQALTLKRIAGDLEDELDRVREKYPHLEMQLTGLAIVSALRSNDTISSLNGALLLAVVLVMVLVGLLFWSVEFALLSLVANLFPIALAGSWLYVSGIGMQYVSVVGLTVAFGIAVDDTVHFLNRYRLQRLAGLPVLNALRLTVRSIGPVLIMTTVVIMCGLASTFVSNVPPTRTFGLLCSITLILALIGDVILLPAILMVYEGLKRRARRFTGQPAGRAT
ncbi:efflux RND transporter permease subunit [Dichotomicrobium thermohalophilum]|uniref:SSD domain-containing protein n=1 Tax=Dichotomicrobium thermohalophilum TaxID=933063 RepID=A0A397QC91_9HYPH|nr:MMPL family transporter [Dichotomicrobium thermohalophilum]RIA55714.1 hypothetical protein BXY53_0790 [Dichotomicrobium thermohalophilum]